MVGGVCFGPRFWVLVGWGQGPQVALEEELDILLSFPACSLPAYAEPLSTMVSLMIEVAWWMSPGMGWHPSLSNLRKMAWSP